MPRVAKYTLVRAAQADDDPAFARSVEVLAVSTKETMQRVLKAGGVLYPTEQEAEEAAFKENFQNGAVTGLFPCVAGTFSGSRVKGRAIYIPIQNCQPVAQIPKEILKAIRAIVDYNWAAEEADYAIQENRSPDHIFLSLEMVSNWLNEVNK
jgi:hypothetical protein